jgi:hypothetical protein
MMSIPVLALQDLAILWKIVLVVAAVVLAAVDVVRVAGFLLAASELPSAMDLTCRTSPILAENCFGELRVPFLWMTGHRLD